MSSQTRPALVNRTNAKHHEENEIADDSLIPSSERKRPLAGATVAEDKSARKRVKLQPGVLKHDDGDQEDSGDEEDAPTAPRRPRIWTPLEIMNASMATGSSRMARLPTHSTRPLLRSFVSSNKADVFKVHSMSGASYMTPPYACSYSYGSKRGHKSLLAIATEEGSVHVLDTSKREEWDVEPQRSTFQPHNNGVFDVRWSPNDKSIATTSADKSLCISTLSEGEINPTARLIHHASTVKCVAWDPRRDGDVLCSGGRDGMICVWDLRAGTGMGGNGVKPVIQVAKAHDTGKTAALRKGKVTAPPARGVTSLLFSESDQYSLISSGTYDGILRSWDLRYIDAKRRSKRSESAIKAISSPVHMSSDDPTLYRGTRRARGITCMTPGAGPTAGLLFALANDSRIHTYDMATLEPLSGWTTEPDTDSWSYGHENMQTNSFYVRLAMSPCGRWLASGGARDGCAYLFDVSSSSRTRVQPGLHNDTRGAGIQLYGQKGEVGAVDWAPDHLATCADDGTVRVWRPDIETYRKCEAEPREMEWSWSWAREQC